MYYYILPYDDELFTEYGGPHNRTEWYWNNAAHGKIEFKEKQDPNNGYAVAYVTGHKYKVHWGTGLDFESATLMLSENWTPEDKPIYLVTNYTDGRAKFDL